MSIEFIHTGYLWFLGLIPLTVGLGMLGRRSMSNWRHWTAMAMRTALLIFTIFALAGIQLRLPNNTLTTVFVMDASDSLSPTEHSRGEDFLLQAIEAMPSGDQAAVVVFGHDALVERIASETPILTGLASIPVTTRTNIAGALQLALALFPDQGAKRIVLLSDGRENIGQALEQAKLAASQDIELLYVALGAQPIQAEVLLESLHAPTSVRQGENFDLVVNIHSTAQTDAALRIFIDNTLIETREMHLVPGDNRTRIKIDPSQTNLEPQAGTAFRRFQAQVIPNADSRLQNNHASAFTIVHGPPSILLVEGTHGEGQNLASALESADMVINKVSPAEIPTTLPELAGFQAVILVNVRAEDLPSGVMDILPAYVRDLGMGLLMSGGDKSFGAGGYLRTPLEDTLPVDMEVKSQEQQSNLALVLAVDKSGSMGRCHCDNPDLEQSYSRAESGQPKVDIAKEAIMRAAGALGDRDYLGVIAFDSAAHWVQRVKHLVDPLSLENAIGGFQAEGQTNLESGVQAAYDSLLDIDAKRKHIILLTDGWVHTGDLTTLVKGMQDNGVTLSVVAAGGGSAQYLQVLADSGGGRYYPAKDILSVPDIFLKDTVTSIGEYIVEEPFYPLPAMPSPVLRGLNATQLPPLAGYNGTSAKQIARIDLITPRGDPLLASWQYGLGRASVWTSDLKAQWATEWLAWDDFPKFATQWVGWTLPAPSTEGLEAEVALDGTQAIIQLKALDKNGRPLNFLEGIAKIIDPHLNTTELSLNQIGPGLYEATTQASIPGTYLIRLGVNQGYQSLGQLTLGMVVPYSPEYKVSGLDRGLLAEISRVTGGGELDEPMEAFTHNLPSADHAQEIWRPLLLLAALLLPLDIAIRRVILSPGDLQKAFKWLRDTLPIDQPTRPEHPVSLRRLFQARDRARQRRTPSEETPAKHTPLSQEIEANSGSSEDDMPQVKESPIDDAIPPTTNDHPAQDTLSRLHEAKKRTHR